ncbi:GPP34 family phosphoprotein [Paenibacillus sp. P26]|nr:GPP34 family phosphoprotein [Paenibacillus sp. P26]
MQEIYTLPQEFVLLASDRETHKWRKPLQAYLETYAAGATLIELLSEEAIRLGDKGKLEVNRREEDEDDAARFLLNHLEQAKPQTLKKWVQSFYSRGKVRSALFQTIISPLIASGALKEERYRVMFLFTARRYVPSAAAKDRIVQRIRAEPLENGPVTPQTAMLAMMLGMSKLLRNYFSEYESRELKARLQRMHEEEGEQWESIRLIRKAIEEIDAVMTTVVVTASV